jgi:hypothetical protein
MYPGDGAGARSRLEPRIEKNSIYSNKIGKRVCADVGFSLLDKDCTYTVYIAIDIDWLAELFQIHILYR